MNPGVRTIAEAFLKAESSSKIGTAEYANKLESVGQILQKSGKSVEHLSSYEPEAIVPLLLDLVLELNSKAQERSQAEDVFESYPMLDLQDPDVSAEIDNAFELYSSIDKELSGKLRLTYTEFFFQGKTLAERYGIAARLLKTCQTRNIEPEPLWQRLISKGGLLNDY